MTVSGIVKMITADSVGGRNKTMHVLYIDGNMLLNIKQVRPCREYRAAPWQRRRLFWVRARVCVRVGACVRVSVCVCVCVCV